MDVCDTRIFPGDTYPSVEDADDLAITSVNKEQALAWTQVSGFVFGHDPSCCALWLLRKRLKLVQDIVYLRGIRRTLWCRKWLGFVCVWVHGSGHEIRNEPVSPQNFTAPTQDVADATPNSLVLNSLTHSQARYRELLEDRGSIWSGIGFRFKWLLWRQMNRIQWKTLLMRLLVGPRKNTLAHSLDPINCGGLQHNRERRLQTHDFVRR